MAAINPGERVSETTARLQLTNASQDAWLAPISSKDDVNLHIDGKGDGLVYINGSPALTVDGLGNIDELAEVLAGITIEGADPAAVAAIAKDLQALVNALAHAAPGFDAPTAQGVAGVESIFADQVALDQRITDLVDSLAAVGPAFTQQITDALAAYVPNGATSWEAFILNMIMLSAGVDLSGQGPFVGTTVNSIFTWTGIDLSSPENLIASLNLNTLGAGAGVDEAAVNALIEAQLAGMGPVIMAAIQSQLGRIDDKLNMNLTTDGDGSIVIATNSMTGAQWKVGIDFQTQRDGEVTVNGKRVLTVDDALGTGGAVDTAAVIQAVVDYLEAEGFGTEDPRVQQLIDILSLTPNGTMAAASQTYMQHEMKIEVLTERADQTIEWANEKFTSITDEFDALREQIAALTGLTPEQEAALTNAIDLAQGVVNILGGKPGGGGSLEDVAAVFGSLGETFQAQVEQAVETITTDFQTLLDAMGGKPDSTVEDVQAFFTNMQQALGEAIGSIWKAAPDTITLNTGTPGGKVAITAHSFVDQFQNVDIDFRPYNDGNVTVNGKRVLTVDDALEAGGGIDQAALEAAVQAATADLNGEIAALKQELADLRAFMLEQNQNITDLMYQETSALGQEVLKKADKTVVDANYQALEGFAEDVMNNQFPQRDQMMAEIVEWAMQEFANKSIEARSEEIESTVGALMRAIGGNTVEEVAATFAELEDNIHAAIAQGLEEGFAEKVPVILAALTDHLSNTLGLLGGGGTAADITAAQVAAQIAEVLAEVARLYATKAELGAYAKLDDSGQEITARVINTRGVMFSTNNELLAPVDYPDYGTRMSLVPKFANSIDDAGIVVVHTDLADLAPGG